MKDILIRKMEEKDVEDVFGMMRVFYNSPAILHTSSDEVLRRDIRDAISDMPLIDGFVFEKQDIKVHNQSLQPGERRQGDALVGYAMTSLNYTTEYGGICVWLEDFYLIPQMRNRGFSKRFFQFLEEQYKDAVRFKLEVEEENELAIAAYKKSGYGISPYYLMTKEIIQD